MAQVRKIRWWITAALSIAISFIIGIFAGSSKAAKASVTTTKKSPTIASQSRDPAMIATDSAFNTTKYGRDMIGLGRMTKAPSECELVANEDLSKLDEDCKQLIINQYMYNTILDLQRKINELEKQINVLQGQR